MSDPITKINEDALQNLHWDKIQRITSQFKIFGDYNFTPIEDDKKALIQQAVSNINDICRPTLKALRYKSNRQELQERIARKLADYEGEFNYCMGASNNMRDSNHCSDKFVNQLNNDAVLYIKEVLKDY